MTTHCRSTVVKPSARCADGSAMFITVRSRTTMSCARPITPRMSQRRSRALSVEVASDMIHHFFSLLLRPMLRPS